MRIAVTGANGQLGAELCRRLGNDAVPLTRPGFDLVDGAGVVQTLCDLRPDAVINAAAYTAVDLAESEPDVCRQVNAQAVQYVAEACRRLDCPLVQLSTDYVFGADVSRREPYREADPTGPLSVYGRSKLEGESHAATWPKHFIVRTCGLYGKPSFADRPRNFVEKMLSLARDRTELQIVADQHCTPTYVPHLAEAILFLIQTEDYGIFHVTNTGSTTWHNFASEIFRILNNPIHLARTTSAHFNSSAQRPAYSALDTAKYHNLPGPRMPDWREALAACLDNADKGYAPVSNGRQLSCESPPQATNHSERPK